MHLSDPNPAGTSIGTDKLGQYQHPLETHAIGLHLAHAIGLHLAHAIGLHLARNIYQKKSCKSALSHGFAWPPENRGVLGSIPSLAISKGACVIGVFGDMRAAV
jgi:hypothetical protein